MTLSLGAEISREDHHLRRARNRRAECDDVAVRLHGDGAEVASLRRRYGAPDSKARIERSGRAQTCDPERGGVEVVGEIDAARDHDLSIGFHSLR